MKEEKYQLASRAFVGCPICGNHAIKIYTAFPGYVVNTKYDIYKCNQCITQFIVAPDTPEEIYNAIYSLDCVPGYDRYKKYANEIIRYSDPFKYLSKQESAYHFIYDFLEKANVKLRRILEIGSGLGYLTYALNKAGYSATGIDISNSSVDKAINRFGNYYKHSDLKDLRQNTTDEASKFDLIIATELIEHVVNPVELIKECIPLLKSGGFILLTTPNYYVEKRIWQTDPPPIHRFWFSRRSFEVIAGVLDLNLSFLTDNYPNLLTTSLGSKSTPVSLPHPILCENLRDCCITIRNHNHPFIHRLMYIEKIKLIINFFLKHFIRNTDNLGVALQLSPPPKQ
ncbi:bifunctional 3-demethylubiquinone-9 3-methyltransferase/ 2-octaprenyl-6-hydroxy phenol methylase [Thermoplasmatales archaeon]|nr:bifunctional 3-demethylubiquinone-9 3-methyltransferase/ 2-octaprenyl-6-hydroxy phenol methylase [Thermoplasmatales archaeon]